MKYFYMEILKILTSSEDDNLLNYVKKRKPYGVSVSNSFHCAHVLIINSVRK